MLRRDTAEVKPSEQLVFIPANDSFGLRKYKAYYKKGGHYLYCNRKDEGVFVEGLHPIYIYDHFQQMVLELALKQLDEYLTVNQENTAMYQYDRFWEDALRYAGRLVIPVVPHVSDTHVDEGYLTIYATDYSRREDELICRYDMVNESLSLKYLSWQRADEKPPQDFVAYLFGGRERQILAQRQLDADIMPEPYRAAYLEICRINDFLKKKRTVRAWFDGREKGILCYPRDMQTAAFLIRLENARFVNYRYNYRHDEEGNRVKPGTLNTLPYKLTHYSEELILYREVFSSLNLIAANAGQGKSNI